jgi:hypothetical protein
MQLVRSLTANARDSPNYDLETAEGVSGCVDSIMHELEATRLLQKALQLSIVPAARSPAGAATAESAADKAHLDDAAGTRLKQQQVQHLLRLSSFSSDFLNSAAALSALPAQHLTKLELHVPARTDVPGSLPDVLARLSSLQELHLVSKCDLLPSSCLAGIAQLQQLTQLQLTGKGWGDLQGLQQLFAQPLPLRRLQLDGVLKCTYFSEHRGKGLDLSGLTQFFELVTDKLSKVWVLPAQLTSLQLECVEEASMLQPLKGHQQLQ